MTRRQKKDLIRIIASAAIFLVSFFIPEELIFGYLLSGIIVLAYLLVGYDVIIDALMNIVHLRFLDEKFLMMIATVGAFIIGEYHEACAVMLFYQVGELFQSLAVGKSRRAVKSLMSLRPDIATVIREGEELELLPEEISVGETVLVRPGEKIPLDGVISEGESDLNISALTGESLPCAVSMGDRVLAGSVNLTGLIKVKVEKEYADSTVSKILELVSSSSSKKARVEKFITRFAKVYTPIVVVSAVILAFLPPLAFGFDLAEWVRRALVFLVLSCPCALVISVPLSFFGGIGGASREGILVKGAEYLEALSRVDTFAFDKTGTLTRGEFSVAKVIPNPNEAAPRDEKVRKSLENELLRIAGLLEEYSDHPIAKCIHLFAKERLNDQLCGSVSDVKSIAGRGVSAVVDGKAALAGNLRFMNECGIKAEQECLSGSAVYVAYGGDLLGIISVDDTIKENAKEALSLLKELRIEKTVMLTGDNEAKAAATASALGIDEYRAELLPQDKTGILEDIIADGRKTAYVGDGINDAPTLMRADVGIAMGGIGSDAAIESADVVIMDDQLIKIPRAVKIAKKTMRIVNTNIWFALVVKLIILILGALGYANMWLAVFGDVGVMIIAILNSLRTLKRAE